MHFSKRLLLSLCLLLSSLATAQTLTTLYSFDGLNGSFPEGTLAQGRDGNLYGTTFGEIAGQVIANGTVFRITPQGALSVYYFDGTHGACPTEAMALGTDGLLHGVTQYGGASNDGVVFSIGAQSPIAVQVSFDGPNGQNPAGPLALGVDENYYGVTQFGGANFCGGVGCGTVFKLTPTGTETVLYSFNPVVQQYDQPPGVQGLVYGPDHAFYGTTCCGGSGLGTIFRITPSGNLTTLYNFDRTNGGGVGPSGTLLLANDGNLYGVTSSGGNSNNQGTVFRLDPSGVTVLHTFDGTDGEFPYSGLIQATDGTLYGTTYSGGTFGYGTIFSFTLGGTFTSLHSFDLTDGDGPERLMQHTNGKIYGTTSGGGTSPCVLPFGSGFTCGTVFSLDTGLGPFITFVLPFGRVGSGVQILGQGLTGTTAVTFNGIPATTFAVLSDTFMEAIVPPGATTGPVQVTTPSGVLTSNVNLQIVP